MGKCTLVLAVNVIVETGLNFEGGGQGIYLTTLRSFFVIWCTGIHLNVPLVLGFHLNCTLVLGFHLNGPLILGI